MNQDLILKGKSRDLGGFSVVRSIPQAKRRFVGPFVFLDHLGPLRTTEKNHLDVRPHPHIGLSTVTYLLEGKGHHRDSLGHSQIISPGDINWMTAGRGIVHSERSPEVEVKTNAPLHGIQVWVALPVKDEEIGPSFTHYPKELMPKFKIDEVFEGTLLVGDFRTHKSPVKTYSSTLFMDIFSTSGGESKLSFEQKEIGLFLVSGRAKINGEQLGLDDLIIVADPGAIQMEVGPDTRLIAIGGEPHPEPRYIWWNFVSSRKERIQEAALAWKNQDMGKVPEESDFTPLPTDPFPV